jgi:methionyl-tRNA formyltransferase
MKKAVLFGNQKISIDCIRLLKKTSGINLLAVIGCETYNDNELGYPSVKKFCLENKIIYYNPPRLDDDFLKIFSGLKPDICFSIYYRYIFKTKYLDVPPMGFVNLHPSLLPKYRGPVPTLWALLKGDKKTGITLHYINSGVDTGDIIKSKDFPISDTITGFRLHSELMKVGFELFKKELPSLLQGTNKRIKQNNMRATYYGQYQNFLRKINWYDSIEKIGNQIRAFTRPYKGAISAIGDKNIVIWKCKKIVFNFPLAGPGKIVKINPDGSFIVSGVDGFLSILQYEIEGVPLTELNSFIHLNTKFSF